MVLEQPAESYSLSDLFDGGGAGEDSSSPAPYVTSTKNRFNVFWSKVSLLDKADSNSNSEQIHC